MFVLAAESSVLGLPVSTNTVIVIGFLIAGAVIAKIIDTIINSGELKHSEADLLREELRKEGRIQHAEIARLEHELEIYKSKYYDMLALVERLKLELAQVKLQQGRD